MRVVLSVSRRELRGGGGDASFVRNLLQSRYDGVRYFLPEGTATILGRKLARLSGRLSASSFLPLTARSRLFYLSYFTYLPSRPTADVVHAHGFLPLGHSELPVVWMTAGSNQPHEKYYCQCRQVYLPIWETALRRAQVVVCWTEAGAQWISELCGTSRDCIRVIPPFVPSSQGADRCAHPEFDHAVMRVIYVGADARRKGLDVAVRAFRKLADHNSSLEFHVVGPKQRDAAWVHPRLRFWGPCDSQTTSSLLRQSHILVLPTYAETFGLALLEAMAAGLAIVTSRIEPLTEIVSEGREGFLVTPGDVEELAAKVGCLIENTTLRQQMRAAALAKWKQNYSEAAVMPKLLAAYREAAEGFHGRKDGR